MGPLLLLCLLSLISAAYSFTLPGNSGCQSSRRKEHRLFGIGVGIDLGTTHSAVAILDNGGVPRILEIPHNGRTMPSVVSVLPGSDDQNRHQVVVGKEAIKMEQGNPFGTYRNVKRVIGSGEIAAREVASVVPNLCIRSDTTKTKSKKNFGLMKQILNAQEHPAKLYLPSLSGSDGCNPDDPSAKVVSPEIISSYILEHLYQVASNFTGQPVDRAVIGVPAYFHDEQREATVRASKIAGVEKVKLLREPEAAALSYGIGKKLVGQDDQDELVLVFDLGGGTYDVSMLMVGGGLTEVISTSGNSVLGGADFDLRIAEHFTRLLQQNGVALNFLKIPEVADVMVRAAEQVRISLSNHRRVQIALPLEQEGWTSLENARDLILPTPLSDLTESGTVEGSSLLVELSRKTVEALCNDEFQALLRPIREVAIMSGALLPGDARPSVVEAALELEEEIGQAMREGDALAFKDFYDAQDDLVHQTQSKVVGDDDVDPDTILQLQEMDLKHSKKAQQKGRKKAREVAKKDKKFRAEKQKVVAQVSDVKVRDGISGRPISQVVLVGGATRMPAIGRLMAALTGAVPQRTVNPDEAIAIGCAIQAGVLDGNENLGGLTVLTPIQAAVMRAVAEEQGLLDMN